MNMPCEDCFARGIKSCKILTEFVCRKRGKCSFYKSKQQYYGDLRKYPPIDYKLYCDTGEIKYIDIDKTKG